MSSRPRNREGTLRQLQAECPVLTLYERFEQLMAIVLSAVIAVIVVVSLVQLIRDIHTTGAATFAALSGALLALGAVYWLIRERDHPPPVARGEP